MASSTSAYSFTDEEVSQLANCNDQDEFLHFFQRILRYSHTSFLLSGSPYRRFGIKNWGNMRDLVQIEPAATSDPDAR